MQKLFMLSIASVLILFSSCKKDETSQPGGGGGGTTTKLLKKITKTEAGQTTVHNLQYDDQKRLISIRTADDSEVTLFTYDAAGNLLKIDQTEEQFHNIYTYTYAGGIPASATFKSWERAVGAPDELIEDDELTYTVANGKVTAMHLDMLMSGSEVDFALTYAGNNLTKVQTVGNDWMTATFTWGAKKSPYPQAAKFVMDHAGFSLLVYAKNEMLSSNFDFMGTALDKVSTYQYTYDSAGYPITSNDGTELLQFEYQ